VKTTSNMVANKTILQLTILIFTRQSPADT